MPVKKADRVPDYDSDRDSVVSTGSNAPGLLVPKRKIPKEEEARKKKEKEEEAKQKMLATSKATSKGPQKDPSSTTTKQDKKHLGLSKRVGGSSKYL